MNLIYLSNRYTRHQVELCREFYNIFDEFVFVETERKDIQLPIGKQVGCETPIYVKHITDVKDVNELIFGADIVLFGSCPISLVEHRLKAGKLTFKYAERIFKTGIKWWQLPFRLVKDYYRYNRFNNFYLLSASAYTSLDFALSLSFLGKSYKWGYFPSITTKSFDELISRKMMNDRLTILWVGRLIDWKHPEYAIDLAKNLVMEGYDFTMNIVGFGPEDYRIIQAISKENIANNVRFCGSMDAEQVLEMMESTDILIFTSDFNEGWGAVLNEGMACGCAVVASHAIGSVPFLINNKNGFVYEFGDKVGFSNHVKSLLIDSNLRVNLSKSAYDTIHIKWNAKNAANRFSELATSLLTNEQIDIDQSEPCSKAPLICNNWIR